MEKRLEILKQLKQNALDNGDVVRVARWEMAIQNHFSLSSFRADQGGK